MLIINLWYLSPKSCPFLSKRVSNICFTFVILICLILFSIDHVCSLYQTPYNNWRCLSQCLTHSPPCLVDASDIPPWIGRASVSIPFLFLSFLFSFFDIYSDRNTSFDWKAFHDNFDSVNMGYLSSIAWFAGISPVDIDMLSGEWIYTCIGIAHKYCYSVTSNKILLINFASRHIGILLQ